MIFRAGLDWPWHSLNSLRSNFSHVEFCSKSLGISALGGGQGPGSAYGHAKSLCPSAPRAWSTSWSVCILADAVHAGGRPHCLRRWAPPARDLIFLHLHNHLGPRALWLTQWLSICPFTPKRKKDFFTHSWPRFRHELSHPVTCSRATCPDPYTVVDLHNNKASHYMKMNMTYMLHSQASWNSQPEPIMGQVGAGNPLRTWQKC